MLILTRYFTREFLKKFMLCMAAFIVLYLMVDFFERLDDMIKHRVPVSLIIRYYLCNIPMIIYQTCPLGVLLCTFITLGVFVRNQEITALKAHGISLFRVLKVFVLVSLGLCLFSLWLQEYVLPYTNSQVKEIKNVHIKGKKSSRLNKSYRFWYRVKNRVYNIDFIDQEKNMLQKITILYFDPDVFLEKRVDAEKALWVDDTWLFENGTIREFAPEGRMAFSRFDQKKFSIEKTPEDFKISSKEGDEMSLSEIRSFIKTIRKEGYRSTPYEVDMHTKVSYPFISMIMAILGIPFALRIGRSGGMALGIALSIALGFMYWTFFAFCLSLGKGGALPPFVSAWIANTAFGSLGLYMFLQVRQ